MDLGDKIKELRKQKGMTQADLGLAIGVCYQSISDWEHKKYNPSYDNISELERVLGEPLRGYSLVLPRKTVKISIKDKKPVCGENKPVDVGKIGALYRARWSIEEIARDVHIPASEVVKYLRRMKKDGKINTSPQQRD